ncbi:translation initiation factor IF-2 [Tengunoibacter tsumagoiensis]|uniref:Translation initiation factor IF-2 n=1 Tax=Tengunoibacter tsumagoiensis TaxID=2014871 RepID=A0A402A328_9CHLR|nr:translation initiation factor IF-2 [Tengunoibacter tsumagoiensis]GCE13449.1 hypothetical protein KTT_33080 [Tengunoibacter tsumagoiensis]
MRDISEIPGGTEQSNSSTTPNQKPKAPARSKPEQTAPGSQEQEPKQQAPRRRPTNPSTQNAPTASTDTHENTEGASAPTQTNARPAQSGSAPAQRPMGQGGPRNPNPRPNGPNPNYRNNNGPRPAGMGGPGNNPGGPRPAGMNGPNNAGGPRPAGMGGPGNNAGGPRPPMNRDRFQNQPPRSNVGAPQQQRPPMPGNAPGPQGPGSYGPPQRQSNGPRPGSGSGRSGGPAGPRSGGPGHSGGNGNRQSNRPANAPARPPQERRPAPVKEKPTGPISLPPQIVVKDLAELLSVSPIEVISNLIKKHSIFASINQVVEYEKAALVAKDLGFEPSPSTMTTTPAVQKQSASEAQSIAAETDRTEVIPPVITIMGHVDHGKTSLLDTIRKTKVAAGEAGGITQHIGAYQVEVNGKKITFLDTPGHEAFTAMRARGAQSAHIAIIVVAADDGVMPQTREAIDHAKAAKMPLIIALNKIDKANANPDRVKQQLTEIGVVIEEYGGDIVCVPISARRGEGIDELLEYILLVAEVQDIRANPDRLATGIIIEAKLEKNSGATATVLVQQGTLKRGDNIVVGGIAGKVRAMFNDRGKLIQKATPSTPVSILGLPEVPNAGDRLEVAADEKTAKQMAQDEAEKRRLETMPLGQVSLDTLYMQMQEGKVKELNVVLKSDVQGSSEAIKGSLSKLGEDNMKVRLIHEGIGNISETDVHLAGASGAIIIGFNVKADGAAQREAQKEGVDIRYYNVIYKLIDDIQAALVGMLEPTYREVIDGHAEVIQIFKAGKTTVIAGSRITDGKLTRSSQARLLRKGEKVHEGKIGSLRRGKDDVREVASGYECGIVLEDFIEFEVGDIIEAFSQERVLPGA